MLQRRGFAAFGVFRGVGRGSRANEIKPSPQAPIFVLSARMQNKRKMRENGSNTSVFKGLRGSEQADP
jgi:hypothetical protein